MSRMSPSAEQVDAGTLPPRTLTTLSIQKPGLVCQVFEISASLPPLRGVGLRPNACACPVQTV
jgi:hypothetical protein